MKNKKYSWSEFEKDANLLAKRLKTKGKDITGVYGLPRGGLCLAVRLSHLLGVRLITEKRRIKGTTLVVDDISDTGNQLSDLTKKPTSCWGVATLFKRKGTKFNPDFFVKQAQNYYIIFPWEQTSNEKTR
jgi:hypoxanthine phosphoribosyltransferase